MATSGTDRCPVCTWSAGAPARRVHRWPLDRCPCCGARVDPVPGLGPDPGPGADDEAAVRHAELRAAWIAGGAVWCSPSAPSGWDARPQLVALGVEGHLVHAAQVPVAATDVDLVSGLLWGAGVSAVGEELRPDGSVVLRSDLPRGGAEALQAALGDRWRVEVATVDDGRDAWRQHARVVRAGRVVVHPPWVPLGPVADGEVVVEVDPGPTFGHGAHPTTRLCLAALDRLLAQHPGAHVLDVGCGSGVLAVAALRLGAARAVGTDIDPEALRVTRATAERNGVGDRVVVQLADAPLDDRFDVVVANIGAAALRAMAPWLAARVAPGGALVLSGLLDPPPGDLADDLAPLVPAPDECLDGWTALTFRSADGIRRETA